MQPLEDSTAKSVSSLAAPEVLSQLWEELLVRHGACWGRAVSHSMYPVIREGDRVLIERTSSEKVRFGDIVVFRRSGRFVIHRVLGTRTAGGVQHFMEKGDGNLGAGLVPREDVIGRVRAIQSPTRTTDIASGLGRTVQYILALYSLGCLHLWALLERVLTRGRKGGSGVPYAATYHRFCSLPPAIMLRVLRIR